MSLVLVAGNRALAISLLLSVAWPRASIVIEGDLAGGVLSAWFELPSGPSLADAVLRDASEIESSIRMLPCGVQAIVAPIRSLEAAACIRHAERELLPRLGSFLSPDGKPLDVIVNVGTPNSAGSPLTGLESAHAVVVTHVEAGLDPGLAAIRVMRLVERIDVLGLHRTPVAAILAGLGRFPLPEIAAALDPVPVHGFDLEASISGLLTPRTRARRVLRHRSRQLRTALTAMATDIATLANP